MNTPTTPAAELAAAHVALVMTGLHAPEGRPHLRRSRIARAPTWERQGSLASIRSAARS